MAPIIPIMVYGGLIATELGSLVITAHSVRKIVAALERAEKEREALLKQIVIESEED